MVPKLDVEQHFLSSQDTPLPPPKAMVWYGRRNSDNLNLVGNIVQVDSVHKFRFLFNDSSCHNCKDTVTTVQQERTKSPIFTNLAVLVAIEAQAAPSGPVLTVALHDLS